MNFVQQGESQNLTELNNFIANLYINLLLISGS